MNAHLAIAIDGPAGAGKSVFGAALASALQAICIDSGIVYRAVTWIAITRGLDPDHDATLGPVAASMNLQIIPPTVHDGRQFTILIDGEDVTWELRTPDIDRTVSRPSALPGVRSAVTEQLRHLARGARVVMVGRDIGTVVLPDADVKFYVTATPETRARRRADELHARGQEAVVADILRSIIERDAMDSGRATAPLRPADDAVHLETDNLTVDAEVAFALDVVQRTLRSANALETNDV